MYPERTGWQTYIPFAPQFSSGLRQSEVGHDVDGQGREKFSPRTNLTKSSGPSPTQVRRSRVKPPDVTISLNLDESIDPAYSNRHETLPILSTGWAPVSRLFSILPRHGPAKGPYLVGMNPLAPSGPCPPLLTHMALAAIGTLRWGIMCRFKKKKDGQPRPMPGSQPPRLCSAPDGTMTVQGSSTLAYYVMWHTTPQRPPCSRTRGQNWLTARPFAPLRQEVQIWDSSSRLSCLRRSSCSRTLMPPHRPLRILIPISRIQNLSADFVESTDALRAWAAGEGEDLEVRPIPTLSVTRGHQLGLPGHVLRVCDPVKSLGFISRIFR